MANETTVYTQQYLRKYTLIVSDNQNNGLDLSQMRIRFSVKRSTTMTPNTADIRIYNLSDSTALQMLTQLSPITGSNQIQINRGKVTLQAGYEGNYGVIFQGDIKQIIIGRESATDTFVDIIAGSGDRAFNFAVVNTTLAAGSTQSDQAAVAIGAMNQKGITSAHVGDLPNDKLPRGKVMFGASKNYLKGVAETTNNSWSIQDSQVQFVPLKSYLPGERVVITAKTGMIGTPQQTNTGVNVKCLLNPTIKVNSLVQLDNKSIEQFKINLNVVNSSANIPAPLSADGSYFVLVAEHTGDTRGVDWYTTLTCINQSVTTNKRNSVQVGYGDDN